MSEPLPQTIVRHAIDIISDPDRWCRFGMATTKDGREHISPFADDAARFCAIGALHKAALALTGSGRESAPIVRSLITSIEITTGRCLTQTNDELSNGRTEILKLYKQYLAKEQANG